MSLCLNKKIEAELRSIPGNNVEIIDIYCNYIFFSFFSSMCFVIVLQICCDCDEKNPQWASVSFGTFMCLECSGRHRALGVHISFVRSVTMDSWSDKQVPRNNFSVKLPYKICMCYIL